MPVTTNQPDNLPLNEYPGKPRTRGLSGVFIKSGEAYLLIFAMRGAYEDEDTRTR